MLSLRYHRQYLWVFFVMFMLLVCVALAMDCYFVSSGNNGNSGGNSFQLRIPRLMNVICVGAFASISVFLQHSISRAIIKPDVLAGNKEEWYRKNIKVKTRRKVKKVANKRRHIEFMFGSMTCSIINLIPVIVLYSLWAADVSGVSDAMKFTNVTNRTLFTPEFFIPAIFIKYFA